jgi:CDP-glucose 4,6-dehydratase
MEGVAVTVEKEFWRGKRVVLTGHTGFKGAWLALWLEHLGAHVTGLSLNVPSTPSLFEALAPGSSVHDLRGDVRDLKVVASVLHKASPEIIFHLAAQSLVRPSYTDPVETYATNVLGTVHVLEAARNTPSVRAVINVTSDKCYQNFETSHAYTESDRFGGDDPYSSSKGCAELVSAAYQKSFFAKSSTGLASARAGNVIGGGDWSVDRLLADCVRAFAARETLIIRNPTAVRPWQHVLEALRGYLLLAQHLYRAPREFSEGFNFGPDASDAKPVSYLAEALCKRWGAEAQYRVAQPGEGSSPHEAHLLCLDSSHATKKLGWKPLLSLDQALDWTVSWYKEFYSGRSMRDVSVEHIEQIAQLERRL